jgi:hypothetical protein
MVVCGLPVAATNNASGEEVPPPGAGFETVTDIVEEVAVLFAGTDTRKCEVST